MLLKALALARDYSRLALSLPFATTAPPARPPRKILFLGYAAVGDLIFLLPALAALRRGVPEARLVFVGGDDTGTNELLPATGLVDEIWRYTHEQLATAKTRRELGRRVAAAGFDCAVVSQGTPLRPFARALLRVPRRIGHVRPIEAPHEGWSAPRYAVWRLRRGTIHGEWERRWTLTEKLPAREEEKHVVSRNLELAAAVGVPVPPPADSRPALPLSDADRAFAERALPADGRKTIGLHLGSPRAQFEKLWPTERWAEAARELVSRHGCRLAVIGGPDERGRLEAFRGAFGGDFVDLVGRGRLLESFAAIARCDLFLSSDTGPSKAAMALGVPTVTVWGPVSPVDQGIVWEPHKHADVSLGISCAPCVRMSLRHEGAGVINFSTCGHHDCLAKLTPAMVLGRIEKLYGSRLSV